MEHIVYYNDNESPFGLLSNHANVIMEINKTEYPSVTNYIYSNIKGIKGVSKILLRNRNPLQMESVFNRLYNNALDEHSKEACEIACQNRISQHQLLKNILLDTGNDILTFNKGSDSVIDRHYVDCLMDIRGKLRFDRRFDTETHIYNIYLALYILERKIRSGESNLDEYLDKNAYDIIDEYGRENVERQFRLKMSDVVKMFLTMRQEDTPSTIEANREDKIHAKMVEMEYHMPKHLVLLVQMQHGNTFNAIRHEKIIDTILQSMLETANDNVKGNMKDNMYAFVSLSSETFLSIRNKVESMYKLNPEIFSNMLTGIPSAIDMNMVMAEYEVLNEEYQSMENAINHVFEKGAEVRSYREIDSILRPDNMDEEFAFDVDGLTYPTIMHYIFMSNILTFCTDYETRIHARSQLFEDGVYKTVRQLLLTPYLQESIYKEKLRFNEIGNMHKLGLDKDMKIVRRTRTLRVLKSTGKSHLIFSDFMDTQLGMDDCNNGKNMQGELLMKIRDSIKEDIEPIEIVRVERPSEKILEVCIRKANEILRLCQLLNNYHGNTHCKYSGRQITEIIYSVFRCGHMMEGDTPIPLLGDWFAQSVNIKDPVAFSQLSKYISRQLQHIREENVDEISNYFFNIYKNTVSMRKKAVNILPKIMEKNLGQKEYTDIKSNVSMPMVRVPFDEANDQSDLFNYGLNAFARLFKFVEPKRNLSIHQKEIDLVSQWFQLDVSDITLSENDMERAMSIFEFFSIKIEEKQLEKLMSMLSGLSDHEKIKRLVFYSGTTIYPIFFKKVVPRPEIEIPELDELILVDDESDEEEEKDDESDIEIELESDEDEGEDEY
jgi:predicted NAD-dependent protein-ADP-ribosyltransferase YbiA (DUF1768 family)